MPTFDSSNKARINMNHRQLFIDFELYAENDPDFKKELIELMLKDVLELQQTLKLAVELNDVSMYRNSCHKMNSTLTILDDQELLSVIGEIKKDIQNSELTGFFNKICSEIVNSLKMNQMLESSPA
jgi:hypothetical protein